MNCEIKARVVSTRDTNEWNEVCPDKGKEKIPFEVVDKGYDIIEWYHKSKYHPS